MIKKQEQFVRSASGIVAERPQRSEDLQQEPDGNFVAGTPFLRFPSFILFYSFPCCHPFIFKFNGW